MFRVGAEYHWKELLERITGKPFQPKYFVEAFQHAEDA